MRLTSLILRAAMVAAVATAMVAAAPGGASASPVTTAASAVGTGVHHQPEQDDDVSLHTELLDTPLEKDGSFRISLTVTNTSDHDLSSGHVVLSAGNAPFSTRAELGTFLDASNGSADAPTTLDTVDIPSIEAGGTWTGKPITVEADDLDIADAYGAYALAGTYVSGSVTAQSRDAFVYQTGDKHPSLDVSVVMPITLPHDAPALVDADKLEAYTGPEGLLTTQLDGAAGMPVTLGIDPRIIASIRALGSSAPDSALEWLDRLENASNDTFPLQYADADPTVQLQAGSDSLLQPVSLAYGVDPDDFTPPEEPEPSDDATLDPTPDETGEPGSAHVTDTPVPTPKPTADDDGVPTLEGLLEFPYTLDSIVWPADDTVTAKDLGTLGDADEGPVILSSSNTTADPHTTVPASARVGETDVRVADSAASKDLRDAVTAKGETSQKDALTALESELVVMSQEPDADGKDVILTLDRQWPTSADRLSSVLRHVRDMTSVSTQPLSEIDDAARNAITIDDAKQSGERIEQTKEISSYDDEIASFASVLDDPDVLIGRHQARSLALLSIGWLDDAQSHKDLSDAVSDFTQASREVLDSVQIVPSSPILMIADQISIKIAVRNSLDLPVNVVMEASPDNPRLTVKRSEVTTVPAKTQQSVAIPVTSRLGNGDVNLRMQLFSPSGVSLGESSSVPVTVRADWERIGTTILILAVVLLFSFGLVRTLRRRRRERTTAAASDTDDAAEDASAEDRDDEDAAESSGTSGDGDDKETDG